MPGTHTNLIYHLVFSTKGRISLINETIREELYRYLGGIIRGESGISLEIGGMPDHVHILTKLKPTISVSDMLRRLKANSSKWVNETWASKGKFGWQDGYAAFTVSESQVARVAKYIRDQHGHHRRVPFTEEFVELLKRHGIEYDERYLWD